MAWIYLVESEDCRKKLDDLKKEFMVIEKKIEKFFDIREVWPLKRKIVECLVFMMRFLQDLIVESMKHFANILDAIAGEKGELGNYIPRLAQKK